MLLTLLFIQAIGQGQAHSPSETFATIQQTTEAVTVHLEIPWSIAEAVKSANPQLGDNPAEQEFWPFLLNYVETHVKVLHDNKALPVLSIQKGTGEHTHSATLVLIYPERELAKLTIHNSLLFNLYSHQENHLKAMWQDGTVSHYVTTPSKPYINLSSETNMRNIPFLIGLFLFGAIVTLILIYRQKFYSSRVQHLFTIKQAS